MSRHQTEVRTTTNNKRRCRKRPLRQLEVDIEKYQVLLEDPSLDAEQRAKFLTALLSVVIAFIDLGYRIHPVQQTTDDFPVGVDLNRAILCAVEEHWREVAE